MTFDRNEAKTLLTQTPYGILNYQMVGRIGLQSSAVLLRLCGGQVQYGEEFYIHQERLAKDLKLAVRTVRREIEKLQKKKLLKVIRRKTDNCNWYRLNNKEILKLTLEVEDQESGSEADSHGTVSPVVADRESGGYGTACPVVADTQSPYSNIETSTEKKYKNKEQKNYKENNKDTAVAKSALADLCVAVLGGFFSMDGTGNYGDSYHAEFVHEAILLYRQRCCIGHLSKEEVDASFECEEWFGIPPANEPRRGKFYTEKDNSPNPKPLRSEPLSHGTSKPIQSEHPVPAKRSDGNSEPTPAETAAEREAKNAEQMAKIEAFRRWWDKVLDDDDDDDE